MRPRRRRSPPTARPRLRQRGRACRDARRRPRPARRGGPVPRSGRRRRGQPARESQAGRGPPGRRATGRSSRERPPVAFWPVRRYHVTTFGCQMNAHDSERIKGMLEELGLGEATSQAEADVLVFNTCTIREKPDQRFAAHLAQARALKQRDPEKVIAVGGCYAEAQRDRLFSLYPYVDVAFGPGTISHLADWLGAGGEAPRSRFGIADERAFAGQLPMHRERRFQAWIQGSMGCN